MLSLFNISQEELEKSPNTEMTNERRTANELTRNLARSPVTVFIGQDAVTRIINLKFRNEWSSLRKRFVHKSLQMLHATLSMTVAIALSVLEFSTSDDAVTNINVSLRVLLLVLLLSLQYLSDESLELPNA